MSKKNSKQRGHNTSRKHNQKRHYDSNKNVDVDPLSKKGSTDITEEKDDTGKRTYPKTEYKPAFYESGKFLALIMSIYLVVGIGSIIYTTTSMNKNDSSVVYVPYVEGNDKEKVQKDKPTTVVNNYYISANKVTINDKVVSDNKPDDTVSTVNTPGGYEYDSSDNITTDNEYTENIKPITLSFNKVGYITTLTVNAREDANIFSDVNTQYQWNDKIEYTDDPEAVSMNGWVRTKDGYVAAMYVSDEEVDSVEYNVAGCDRRKSYMDYKKITSKGSKQYKLQKLSITDYSTGIRVVNGRYEIALGSGYQCKIGQYVDLELEDGTILECVVGEAKANCDTNKWHTVGKDGGVAEFIVDTPVLSKLVKKHGDVSHTSNRFSTNVAKVVRYDYCLL